MIGVEHRSGQRAAGAGGHPQGVGDQVGAHVVGDGPADDLAAEAVQYRREIEELPVLEREIRDVAHEFAPGLGGGEVPAEQVCDLPGCRIGDGRADASAQADPGDGERPHDPCDPLLVDPVSVLAEHSGHPRGAVGAAGLAVDLTDLVGQDSVLLFPGSPGLRAGEPLVVTGPVDVQDVAEPLHLVGGPVVINKLEAAGHQFVSPAKHLAALRRMSRSVASLRSLASSSATRASSRRTPSSGSADGTAARWAAAGFPPAAVTPRRSRSRSTHSRRVARLTPGQRRCSCTSPRVWTRTGPSIGLELVRIVLHRHRRSSRFLRIKQIQYQRVHQSGGAPAS